MYEDSLTHIHVLYYCMQTDGGGMVAVAVAEKDR